MWETSTRGEVCHMTTKPLFPSLFKAWSAAARTCARSMLGRGLFRTLTFGLLMFIAPQVSFGASLYQQGDFSSLVSYTQTANVHLPSLQGQVLNNNQSGMSGTAESFTFYSTYTGWGTVFSQNSSTPFTITWCSVAWTFPSNTPTCTGTTGQLVTMEVAYFPASLSNSGNYWTIIFPSPVTLDSAKFYMANITPLWYTGGSYQTFTYNFGGITTGTCNARWYDLQTGVNTMCLNGLQQMMWALNGTGGYVPSPTIQFNSTPTTTSDFLIWGGTFTIGDYATTSALLPAVSWYDTAATTTIGSLDFEGLHTATSTAWSIWKSSRFSDGHTYVAQAELIDTTIGSRSQGMIATSTPWIFTINATIPSIATSSLDWQAPTAAACDTLDLGCYIRGAIQWAFWPSQSVIDKFNNLDFTSSRAPFIYFTQSPQLYNAFFDSTATSTLEVNVPYLAMGTSTITIFSTTMVNNIPFWSIFKTIFGYLIWFMLIWGLWSQVKRMHDTTTIA